MWGCLPHSRFSDICAAFRWNFYFFPFSQSSLPAGQWFTVGKSNSCHLFSTFYMVLWLLLCFLNPMFFLAFLWSHSFFLLLACTTLFLESRLNRENVSFFCLPHQPITVHLLKKIFFFFSLLSSLCLQSFPKLRLEDVTAQTQKFSGIFKLTTSSEVRGGSEQ